MTTGAGVSRDPGFGPAGRAEQLEALDRLWDSVQGDGVQENGVQAGGPALALVQAPAGLGKSWLTRHWTGRRRARQPEAAIWTVPAGPLLPGLLRAGFQALRHERDPAFLAAAAALLPALPWPVLAQDAAPAADREALWFPLWRVLERVAQRLGGLCLQLEDVHDYFPDDLAALHSLWGRLQLSRTPLLLLLSARPEGGQDLWDALCLPKPAVRPLPGLHRLELGPLDRGGLEGLCAGLLQSESFPAELVGWLHGRSEGHPLHATELLHFLMAGGALRDLGGTWQFVPPPGHATPRGLEAVLSARLQAARREPELWRALSALAVVDRPLALQPWARVCQLSPETLGWAQGRAAHLGLARNELTQGQTLHTLAHPLYGPLLRSMLTQDERQALGLRALEVAASPVERAGFARQCGHPRALEWTRAALTLACEQYAWDTAVRQAQALLTLPGLDEAGQQEATETLGVALMNTSQFAGALDALGELETPGAVELRAYMLARLGRDQEGYEYTNRHVADHQDRLRYYWTCFPMRLGRQQEAWERLQGYLQRTRGQVSLDRILALVSESWYLRIYEPHRLGRHLELWQEAARLYGAQGVPAQDQVYGELWNMEYLALLGEWDEARERRERLRAMASRYGDFDLRQNRLVAQGHLALLEGEYGLAHELLLEALRCSEANQDPVHASYARYYLYCAACERGDAAGAAEHLAGFQAVNASVGQLRYDAPRDLEIGWRQAALGRLDPAERAALSPRLAGELHGRDLLAAARLQLLEDRPEHALATLEQWQPQHWQGDSGPRVQADPPERSLLRGLALLRLEWANEAQAVLQAGLDAVNRTGHGPLKRDFQALLALATGGPAQVGPAVSPFVARICALREPVATAVTPVSAVPALQVRAAAPRRFIRTLGAFGMEEDGQLRPWRARKTRELLALLLCAQLREDGPGVPRTRLLDALWPDADEPAAEQNFRTTLKRLRASLGDAGQINRDSRGDYLLQGARADVLLFLEAQTRHDLEGALGWYGGEFLAGLELDEAQPLADMLRARWRETALRLLAERGPVRGTELYRRLLLADPYDLPVILGHAHELRLAGAPAQAGEVLGRAAARFLQDLGQVPQELVEAQQAVSVWRAG